MEPSKKILFINACARPQSRTCRLAWEVLKKLAGDVTELKLYEEGIEPLDFSAMEKRSQLAAAQDFDDEMFRYAKQFAAADEIVIAAPYWDLSFPSILKVYLELICVVGIAFQYTPEGIPAGLCKAKRVIYTMTAGGPVYENMGFDYVKSLCDVFLGIHEHICFSVQNIDVAGADEDSILKKALDEIEGWEA